MISSPNFMRQKLAQLLHRLLPCQLAKSCSTSHSSGLGLFRGFQSYKGNYIFNRTNFAVIKRSCQTMSNWRPPPPCHVGDDVKSVDSPCLTIDLDMLDENLTRLHKKMMGEYPKVAVRPHAKAHKCPALAKIQMERGAVGMCCQTLTEAEAMVHGGGSLDILISNQLIGRSKLQRMAQLAKQATIGVCVDDADNVREISAVAQENDVTIHCVVEVNVGQNRCGVVPGPAAADLAQLILSLPHITFKGLQCYQGANQHIRKAVDRKAAVDVVVHKAKQCLQALKERNIECSYVTGGGTGTYLYEAASEVFTEVQPGSYILMDADYGRNYIEADKSFTESFEQSLLVATTVQSVTRPDRCVVDAGMKAVSLDSGEPLVQGYPDITYTCGGDEHGILSPASNFKVGDQLFLIPGHCDPTVNMYDWLVGVRNSRVETVWPVLGRGPGV